MITFHPDEEIVLVKRRHWLPIALQAVGFSVVATVPLVIIFAANISPAISKEVAPYEPLELFIAAAWAFFTWISFFVSWTNYYLDILAITNKRILDIEQVGLFTRNIAELRVEHVEDIKVEVLGFVASLLDFGNLYIQSAGATKEVVLKHIPNPHAVREAISKLQEEISRKHYQQGTEN